MKTLGIVGGIAPESTIEYYRLLIASYRERKPDGSAPSIVIDSIDLKKLLDLTGAGDLEGLTSYLLGEVRLLARAGADLGLLAANTPHIVFHEVLRQSPIPLVSIVEATCAAAKALGLKKLALFGTRFTMQGRFYPDVFSREGIALVVPAEDDLAFIHDTYVGELVKGVYRPEARAKLLAIVGRMREGEGVEGVILGGTELPFILKGGTAKGIPLLDTTRIHVEAALDELLGKSV
ncbi:MAG TPA: amino acid racemase [Thermoanaerobaculia bacterium]|nr:amino acid racemase [Thermoanaerobaculia bacterium]